MILVWGSPEDSPVAAVLDALGSRGAAFELLEDGALASLRYELVLGVEPAGVLHVNGRDIDLGALTGVYLRPGPQGSAAGNRAAAALLSAFQVHPARVVNRPAAGQSNHSKPFQLGIIHAIGVAIPDTLVTSDRAAALAFLRQHRRVIYKSLSGIRSIVSAIDHDDAGVARLSSLGHGPAQLQQWIMGTDVRVHVIGQRCFATQVESPAIDYRFPADERGVPSLQACDLPDTLARALVDLTRQMGLLVSGIDLRRTPAGEWYCFEVNPSPGFTYYEAQTGQPIAEAVAELLARGPFG